MIVSKEEELLLEAMREKRVSLCTTDSEGYTSSIDQYYGHRRPKTAEAAKRYSSLFEPDMANFPAPPTYKSDAFKFLQIRRSSLSTNDLHLVEDVPYVERNSILLALKNYLPSRPSSTAQSDVLLSPNSSQGSPHTILPGTRAGESISASQYLGSLDPSQHSNKGMANPERNALDIKGEDKTIMERDQNEHVISQWALETQMELQQSK
jgi:hypothetical protein